MTTLRIKHQRNYTCIANEAIRDRRLSLKARGLHHLLLSYPDGWRVNSNHLTSESDKDGRDAIRSALKELEDCGYLKREAIQDPVTGRYRTDTVIYELPQDATTEDGFSGVGSTGAGLSGVGFSGVGKSGAYISTDQRSTDQRSTDQELTRSLPPTPQKTQRKEERGEEEEVLNEQGEQSKTFSQMPQIPAWKSDDKTFRPEMFEAVFQSFPGTYEAKDGSRSDPKIRSYLRNLEQKGELEQLEMLWRSQVKAQIVNCPQAHNWENDPRKREWLREMEAKGPQLFKYVDRKLDPERMAFVEWALSTGAWEVCHVS